MSALGTFATSHGKDWLASGRMAALPWRGFSGNGSQPGRNVTERRIRTGSYMPVALLLRLARLATRPSLTGSPPKPKTLGVGVAAALAARATAVLPGVAITAT